MMISAGDILKIYDSPHSSKKSRPMYPQGVVKHIFTGCDHPYQMVSERGDPMGWADDDCIRR